MGNLAEKISQLPEPLQQEVEDFVDFIAFRRLSRPGNRLRLNWSGALSEYRDKYTALDLQKISLSWWTK